MVKKEIIELARIFIAALIDKNIRLEKVILFGSYAIGNEHLWSDIDIAVVSPDFGKNRFTERVLLTEIACKLDPRIEPYPVGKDEFENESWKTMIHEIKLNGIEIAA